jgi:hypothetical protein
VTETKHSPLVQLVNGSDRPHLTKAGDVRVGRDWIAARAASKPLVLFKKPRRRHPATTKNTDFLAKAVGGVGLALGPRGHISLYYSKRLRKVDGSVEIWGNAVTMLFEDLTLGEAEAILGVLMFVRAEAKKKGKKS